MELFILSSIPQLAAEFFADQHLADVTELVASQLVHAQLQMLEEHGARRLMAQMKGAKRYVIRSQDELQRRLEKELPSAGERLPLAEDMCANGNAANWYQALGVNLMHEYRFRKHAMHHREYLIDAIRVDGVCMVHGQPRAHDPAALVPLHQSRYFHEFERTASWGGRRPPPWWKRRKSLNAALASAKRTR